MESKKMLANGHEERSMIDFFFLPWVNLVVFLVRSACTCLSV
jgi:hypothetical protein